MFGFLKRKPKYESFPDFLIRWNAGEVVPAADEETEEEAQRQADEETWRTEYWDDYEDDEDDDTCPDCGWPFDDCSCDEFYDEWEEDEEEANV